MTIESNKNRIESEKSSTMRDDSTLDAVVT